MSNSMSSNLTPQEQREMDRITKEAAASDDMSSNLSPQEQKEMDRITKEAAASGEKQAATVPESKGPPSNDAKYLKSRFLTGPNDELAVVDVYEITENKIRSRAEAFLDEAMNALMALLRVPFEMISEIVDSVLDFVDELLSALVDAINDFLGSLPFDLAGLLFGGGAGGAGLEGSGAGLEVTLESLGYASLDLLWDYAGENIQVNPADKDTYIAAKKTLEAARKNPNNTSDVSDEPLTDALNQSAEAFVMGALVDKMIEADITPPLEELFDTFSTDAVREAVATDVFPKVFNPRNEKGPDPKIAEYDPSQPLWTPSSNTQNTVIPASQTTSQTTTHQQDTTTPPDWMNPSFTNTSVNEPTVHIDSRFLEHPILNPTKNKTTSRGTSPSASTFSNTTTPTDPSNSTAPTVNDDLDHTPQQSTSFDQRISVVPPPPFNWLNPTHPAYEQPDEFESYRKGFTPEKPFSVSPGHDSLYHRLTPNEQQQYRQAYTPVPKSEKTEVKTPKTTESPLLWTAMTRSLNYETLDVLKQHISAPSLKKKFPGLIPMILHYYRLPNPLENANDEYTRLIELFNWIDPTWLTPGDDHTESTLSAFTLASKDSIALFCLNDDHTLLNEILISADYRYNDLFNLLKTQYPNAAL